MTETQLLTDILSGVPGAVFVLGEDRQILVMNENARQLFGDELDGANLVQAVRHPDCIAAVDDVLSGAQAKSIEFTLNHPVRTVFRMKASAIVPDGLTDEDFSPRAVVSFEDISHVREAEAMRSDFVANVSHELRSPLTALVGFIETLKAGGVDDVAARDRFLTIMEGEAGRMNRLVGDLLSLSKVESNERLRPQTRVDIAPIIDRAINTLKSLAQKSNVTIDLSDNRAASLEVFGDDDQLLQVFINLLENAIKYGGPDKRVEIKLRDIDRAPGLSSPAIGIEVRDYGPGIEAHHIPRLTERFYRVDASRSREQGGTGLGLAIVKHIIARHRGRLSVASKTGEGTSFTLYLPVVLDNPVLS